MSESVSNFLISPEKKIMGSWKLFEYYTEPDKELIHFAEQELRANDRFMEIHFMPEGECTINGNFELPELPQRKKSFEWEKRRNYISFSNPESNEPEVIFQFAVEKNILKLLKKNKAGKIQFFGFFKKPIPSKQI